VNDSLRVSNAAADDGFVGRFMHLAAIEPERRFATFEGEELCFGALHRRSGAVAAALRRAGIVPGNRVATMLRNSPAMLAILFGLAKAGIVWVPVNVQQRGDGLRHILGHSEPCLCVVEPDLFPLLRESRTTSASVTLPDEIINAQGDFTEAPPGAGAVLAISYTSGTTGPPKGVIVTHRMLRFAGEGVVLAASLRDGDVAFMWEPMYHIGGAQMIVVPLLRRVHLAMVGRFSARRFWADVRESGATHIHYLGGITQILLKQPPNELDWAHRARMAWGGGCPSETWFEFERRFGVRLRECYGMTEASSFTTFNDDGEPGSVGRPVPWFEVDLLDQDGVPVPNGTRGEIVVRTRRPGAIFPGYFRAPEATARALQNGALHTGDLGSRDAAGRLFFHGRMSDSVRCRGENVSAWEVERIAVTHPAVADCAMIGVSAEIGEQEIKLVYSRRPGAWIQPAELSAWLAQRLAPYQNPRYLVEVVEFERTPSQRIMKHRLSARTDDCWDRLNAEHGPTC
jgi:crotonobetaine/carnitine-CoA ligase